MPDLTVREREGRKDLYIEDRVQVDGTSLPVQKYVGRLDTITPAEFAAKLGELDRLKLDRYLEFRLKRYSCDLVGAETARALETIRYRYGRLAALDPERWSHYRASAFLRYVQETTALEGNTLSPAEVRDLLERQVSPAGKRMEEVYGVLNFAALRAFLDAYDGDVSEDLIKDIHAILMENILADPGDYRQAPVCAAGAACRPPPATLVPEMVQGLVEWYRQNRAVVHPFELAVLVHAKFGIIHPFSRGNGRVGRALMNAILEREGYPLLSLGPKHRDAYLDALGQAAGGEFAPMITLLSRAYEEQHRAVAQEFKTGMAEIGWFKRSDLPDLFVRFIELKRGER